MTETLKNNRTHVILVLAGEHRCVVDAEDIPRLAGYAWFGRAPNHAYMYACAKIDGVPVLMHRFIMNAPDGKVVDHINHDTLDNRKANLRVCTHAENMGNRAKSILRPDGYLPWVDRLILESTLLIEQGHTDDANTLSEREFDVFYRLAAGFPIHEIAKELGITASTVSTMRTRAMKKLGCKSNADIVRLAQNLAR